MPIGIDACAYLAMNALDAKWMPHVKEGADRNKNTLAAVVDPLRRNWDETTSTPFQPNFSLLPPANEVEGR